MKRREWTLDEFHEKIKLGFDLAFKKLVAKKRETIKCLFFLKTVKL